MKNIKSKFIDKDGQINGKMLAGLISLVIVLIQQIFASFGIKFTGDLGAIVACINTVLAILGLVGVMSEPATVSFDTSELEKSIAEVADTATSAKVQAIDARATLNHVTTQINTTNQKVANLDQIVTDKVVNS